ncbi:hypothetical protein FOB58_005664 [Candida parapsilosis]|uniref:Uncharacterized protein n=1 Tax=Candida parapsilosis TaxID=5480 RepID=A0A8X7T9U9_CANPA|nr:hypothetical protein FOB58_005664 [Candida parapsilosis]KAF6042460.1 hypothetical protein FOB59_005642 [Candida parapsilosis]KAF6042905.1 hypothetical protein FOB60_005659 [Candida parapsilosis]KAF6058086.1 hypothetical protein FOB61_005675 [Candida parapsilosis]
MLQSPFNFVPKDKRKRSSSPTVTMQRHTDDISSAATPKYSERNKMLLLHTPPPSTHKHHHLRSKKQKVGDACATVTVSHPAQTLSPTPLNYDIKGRENNGTHTAPSTPSIETHQYQDQQVHTPPPTAAKIKPYINRNTSSTSHQRSSSIETKLKIMQLKIDNLEDCSARDEISDLLQSTIDELSQNERELQLPRRKFDEFMFESNDPMTPINQIMSKDDSEFSTPPPLYHQSAADSKQSGNYLNLDDYCIPSFAI